MNSETLAYLKSDAIGQVLAKGLAHLYTVKPPKPVNYLSQWLLAYSETQKELSVAVANLKQVSNHLDTFHQLQKTEITAKTSAQQVIHATEERIKKFKEEVEAAQYQEELLEQVFPEFLTTVAPVTGVYIGHLNHPRKEVTEQDIDEEAHIDKAQPRLINYIGSCKSHVGLMRGKELAVEKGVTAAVFSLPLDPVATEEEPVGPQKLYLYVPNVVKNPNIHYFRLPKLGCYLAVPLIYHSYLSEETFDIALASRETYLEELEEFNTAKATAIQQFATEIAQIDKKIADSTEKNAQQTVIAALKSEKQTILEQKAEKDKQAFKDEVVDLKPRRMDYVVGVDNLGKDTELTGAQISLIHRLVKHFKQSWEDKERQLLEGDIKIQINYLKTLHRPVEEIQTYLEKLNEPTEDDKPNTEGIENQVAKIYAQQQWQFKKLRNYLKQTPNYREYFVTLAKFRVVKFRELIQNILYFLGMTKQQVNKSKQACLDWKNIRNTVISAQVFAKILDYVYEGPKPHPVPEYARVRTILARIESIDEQSLIDYNAGLWIVARFIKKALQIRIANVEFRQAQKEAYKTKRTEIIASNDKINEEKVQALERHKASIPPEEVEAFKEEEWSAKYFQENPLQEIPPEVADDLDEDLAE